ncbi:T-lymphocyte activation antigen CD86 isoform X4 [Macaca fascicularis]|uniref:T-lymphocyte activation antigen CD86 isoform X4 n=2 Tax=Macaca fascicularis TaxID=9541 RepID=UPI0032B06348
MDPQCTMGLSNTLFVMAFLLSEVLLTCMEAKNSVTPARGVQWCHQSLLQPLIPRLKRCFCLSHWNSWDCAAPLKIQAYFNETADLPCQFANSQNRSLSELVVFWQNQENLVLNEVYLGKEKFDSVHSKYMGRTSFDPESWTLRLHNLQIKDKGLYQCIIHHKRPTGMIRIHQMNSELSVLANFSQPEIVPISNITENMYINLTCSSIHGYPEPEKMSVLLRTKNSTIEYDGVMQKSQDNVTELYDVSISLSVSFPDVTSNMTIFCVLETDKTQLLSSPFSIELEDPQPPPDHIPWITAVLPTVIICVMAFCLILWKWKKKKQPRNSYKCGTNTMEREESEQTKKREKINVPERSDEAQCVFKSLKTPSCDKSDTHF